jgi:para-aminobenzoate synthetase/4-amino-4-deoxychorismate lyase
MKPLPHAYHDLAESERNSVLLETSRPGPGNERSYLFVGPERVLTLASLEGAESFFSQVDECLSRGLFVAGFLTYECGYAFETRARAMFRPPSLPIAWFGVYRAPFVFDHRTGLSEPEPPSAPLPRMDGFVLSRYDLATSQEEYCTKVAQIRELIARGDTYQVNLTNRLLFHFSGSPVALFRAVQDLQRVPYAAYIRLDETRILSVSPELFFRIENETILTRPMKGTAPRGADPTEDARLRSWLREDDKNRSENVMIVDLLRNDLAKVSRIGSVKTADVFSVEEYETLFQMTSTVSGRLVRGTKPFGIMKALFPSGSITGAPKVRTMEIIRELEPGPRGIYTGAIGFFSPRGEAIFNVAIRTIVLDSGLGEMGIGSGIVYDSSPEREFEECMLKARFLTECDQGFELLETLLFKDSYSFLPQHVDRLKASAEQLAFPFTEPKILAALEAERATLAQGTPFRVRLLLDRRGGVRVESEPLTAEEDSGTVVMAEERTSSKDPLLRHKTTRRETYARGHKNARALGHLDAIFMNERGEVTEGAVHNVFIRSEGRLFTPPLEGGLLPGVYRRHVLEHDPRASERVLTLQDLVSAEAIYLCNSVRGMRRVSLVQDP